MARAHAAMNCYWVSVAVPAQCSADLASMMIGPDGTVVIGGASGRADLILETIDLGAARFNVALRRARPWRARARAGEIYACRQG